MSASPMADPMGAAPAIRARADTAAAAERIRVLVVGPSLDILGGQSVQASRLLERFQNSAEVTVHFLPVNPRFGNGFELLRRIKYLRTLVTSVIYGVSLLRRVRDYDIVHAFSASYWSYLVAPLPALLVARLFGKKAILNYHSGEAGDHLARSPFAIASMRRLADRIVVPSEYLVTVFRRFGLSANAIANFVDLDAFPYRKRECPRPVFLSNRNFEKHYNVACTLEAFALIQHEVPDARLLIAGDGPERPALEAKARDLDLRHVEFLGRLPVEQMCRLYGVADVYLNSPDIDNMPISIIEAYAAGLPVVTTNAGGIPYIVRNEETGLMVPRGDAAGMARAAIRLLREPALAPRISTAARLECERRYVWQTVEPEWNLVYHQVFGQTTSTNTAARAIG
jgi:glycosyltransferase involved in cell wall biosynthesis